MLRVQEDWCQLLWHRTTSVSMLTMEFIRRYSVTSQYYMKARWLPTAPCPENEHDFVWRWTQLIFSGQCLKNCFGLGRLKLIHERVLRINPLNEAGKGAKSCQFRIKSLGLSMSLVV